MIVSVEMSIAIGLLRSWPTPLSHDRPSIETSYCAFVGKRQLRPGKNLDKKLFVLNMAYSFHWGLSLLKALLLKYRLGRIRKCIARRMGFLSSRNQ